MHVCAETMLVDSEQVDLAAAARPASPTQSGRAPMPSFSPSAEQVLGTPGRAPLGASSSAVAQAASLGRSPPPSGAPTKRRAPALGGATGLDLPSGQKLLSILTSRTPPDCTCSRRGR